MLAPAVLCHTKGTSSPFMLPLFIWIRIAILNIFWGFPVLEGAPGVEFDCDQFFGFFFCY